MTGKMAERLQIAMWAKRVSVEELSTRTGISNKGIRKLLAGCGKWTPDTIVLFCSALQIRTDYLLGQTEEMVIE